MAFCAAVLSPVLSPSLLEWGLGVLIVLALLISWRTRRQWPLWSNLSALLLRAIVLGCAALLILRPENVTLEPMNRPKHLAILVDASQSLLLRSGANRPSRAEQGQEALQEFLARAQERNWSLRAWNAGEQLTERNSEDFTLQPLAGVSPLGEALAQLSGEAKDTDAVVFFSDGNVNRGRPLVEGARPWSKRGVPLYGVLLGDEVPGVPDAVLSPVSLKRHDSPTSPALSEIEVGERVSVEAEAAIAAEGPKLTGPLADSVAHLWVQGPLENVSNEWREADSLRHRLATEPLSTAIKLSFTPPHVGTYRFRLVLDPLRDERIVSNNVRYAELKVRAGRRRVLYASGSLGHDFRYLKTALNDWAEHDGARPEFEIVADFVRPAVESEDKHWPLDARLSAWLPEPDAATPRRGVLIWDDPDLRHLSRSTQTRLFQAIQSGTVGFIGLQRCTPKEWAERNFGGEPEPLRLKILQSEPLLAGIVNAEDLARTHPVTRWKFEAAAGENAPGVAVPDPWVKLGEAHPPEGWVRFSQPSILLSAGRQPWLAVNSGLSVNEPRVAWWFEQAHWRWLSVLPAASNETVAEKLDRADRLSAQETLLKLWANLIDWADGLPPKDTRRVWLHLPSSQWELGSRVRGHVALEGAAENNAGFTIEYALQAVSRDLPPLGAEQPEQGNDKVVWRKFSGERIVNSGSLAGRLEWSGEFEAPEHGGEWLVSVRVKDAQGKLVGSDARYFKSSGTVLELNSIKPDQAAMQAAVDLGRVDGSENKHLFGATKAEMQALIQALEPLMKPTIEERERHTPTYNPLLCVFLLLAALCVDIWLRRT